MKNIKTYDSFNITTKSMDLDQFRSYLRNNDKNKNIFDKIRFFQPNDLSFLSDKIKPHFILLEKNNEIIGLSKIANYPYDNDNVYSVSFFTIDKEFRNKGYSRLMLDELFKLAKQKGWILKSSSYTYVGFIKLRKLFNEYAKKYLVEFIDKKDDDHLIDTKHMYDDNLIHRDEK